MDHGHARGPQGAGVGVALVPERVEARRVDGRRRDARQARRAQRRHAPAVPAAGRQVQLGEPAHGREGEAVPVRPLLPGRVARVHVRVAVAAHGVGDGGDEELRGQRNPLVTAGDGDGRGELPARAVTGDGRPPRRGPGDVQRRGQGVVERGGERMLGRQAVADADDRRTRLHGQPPRVLDVRVLVAGDPAAAVQEHDRGVGEPGRGLDHAGGHGTAGRLQDDVALRRRDRRIGEAGDRQLVPGPELDPEPLDGRLGRRRVLNALPEPLVDVRVEAGSVRHVRPPR
ncbi:hypothetical protein OHR68_09275 [Spirillospora sp. NBC_00431]